MTHERKSRNDSDNTTRGSEYARCNQPAYRAAGKGNLSRFADASPQQIDQRLRELDREWNTERMIETEAPLTVALGAVLGLVHDRRWFALSATAAGMLLHNLQGWYPLLPVLRRLGVRSQNEIEQESSALRALRSGHATRH